MDIRAYIEQHGGTAKRDCPILAQLASASDCSTETLYMIALGHKKASALLSGRISRASDGGVTPSDLRPDIFGEAPDKSEAA